MPCSFYRDLAFQVDEKREIDNKGELGYVNYNSKRTRELKSPKLNTFGWLGQLVFPCVQM